MVGDEDEAGAEALLREAASQHLVEGALVPLALAVNNNTAPR